MGEKHEWFYCFNITSTAVPGLLRYKHDARRLNFSFSLNASKRTTALLHPLIMQWTSDRRCNAARRESRGSSELRVAKLPLT